MKVEKIIEELEYLRFYNQRPGRELWNMKPQDIQNQEIDSIEKYLVDAIAKLEILIPKKPNKEEDLEFEERVCYYCPTCGFPLATNGDDTYYNWWLCHCHKCGQKIDYGGKNDKSRSNKSY